IFSMLVISTIIITGFLSIALPARHVRALPVQPRFNHSLSTHYDGDGQYDDNTPPGAGAEQEQYADRAYPYNAVSYDRAIGAYQAFLSISKHSSAFHEQYWHLIGPKTGNEPAQATYTGAATTVSGRMTAIAIADSCTLDLCPIWVGAAGGG